MSADTQLANRTRLFRNRGSGQSNMSPERRLAIRAQRNRPMGEQQSYASAATKGPTLANPTMPLTSSTTVAGPKGATAATGTTPYQQPQGQSNMSATRRAEIAAQRARPMTEAPVSTAPATGVRGPANAGIRQAVQPATLGIGRPGAGPVYAGGRPLATNATVGPTWGTQGRPSALQAWRQRFRR